MVPSRIRVVEFFCGIGGVAAACPPTWQVVAAIDVNSRALDVYQFNFPHSTWTKGVEHLSVSFLRQLEANLWWFSPPCQPFTVRGKQRDLADPRAHVFPVMVEQVAAVRPDWIALENVAGFQGSRAQTLWVNSLQSLGYTVRERLLCPTELGVPAKRPRWYVMASRAAMVDPPPPLRCPLAPLAHWLDPGVDVHAWEVPADIQQRYGASLSIVDPTQSEACCRCFTSAYGLSPVRSGSYLRTREGLVRYVTPAEILRLLGFPASYRLPPHLTPRQAWSLVGNSLSIDAVRQVLRWLTNSTIAGRELPPNEPNGADDHGSAGR